MNPYRILGVKKTATPEEITKAYRAKVKRLHPDTNPGDEAAKAKYAEVDEAYRILSDPALRAEYDRTGSAPPRRAAPVDAASAELCQVLTPLLMAAIQSAEQNGGVRTARLLDMVRAALANQIREAERHRAAVEKGIAALKAVAERLKVPEGETNVLSDIVRSRAAGVEGELLGAKAELDKLARAKAYLEKASYASDDGGADALLRQLTSKTFVWSMP